MDDRGRTHKARVTASQAGMTPDQIRAAKCQRTKQRNIARKEAMARGVRRRDAMQLRF